MKKITVSFFTLFFLAYTAQSQTLFTYGTKSVSKNEFLQAFNKNPDTTGPRSGKIKEYLDMYVNFKLKIQAALDEKLNTTSEFKSEGVDFRNQLVDNYINDQANINGLIDEAFQRSLKDILLSQVFVEVKPGADTAAAYKQIKEAYDALQSGKDFADVAVQYSTDPSVKETKGAIGYITVFNLPYQVESIVYGLKPGQYSRIYKSSAGYHIFKNVSERPAAGRRKIQQILIATPDSFTPEEKAAREKLADSVYGLLQNGAPFDQMIDLYSAPNNNYDETNTIEVKLGEYSNNFENAVFALKNKNDISKPFKTEYGYNIVKLVDIMPVDTDPNDVVNRAQLQELVQRDNRLEDAKNKLVDKWLQQTKYTKAVYSQDDLWKYTDSALKLKKTFPAYKSLTQKTVIFSFAKQKITAGDWLQYNLNLREEQPYTNETYPDIMRDFVRTSCDKYYREHIEDYYPPIADQLKEFNEANLLFAVMDKHVWSKASEDSAGLLNYYNQHKDQYTWKPGVSALVVTSSSKDLLDSVEGLIKANPARWREIVSNFQTSVLADSSRFENGQLPVKQKVPMEKGFMTSPEENDSHDAYTFIYVCEVFQQPGQRSFDDARGLVINDYQQVLEKNWIAELRKKYPVKINEAVAKTL